MTLKTHSTAQSGKPFTPVAIDFRCRACEGEGSITVIEESCNHAGLRCPCGTNDVECAECGGTGVEPCAYCREEPSTEIGDDNDLICRACKHAESGEAPKESERDGALLRWVRKEVLR